MRRGFREECWRCGGGGGGGDGDDGFRVSEGEIEGGFVGKGETERGITTIKRMVESRVDEN